MWIGNNHNFIEFVDETKSLSWNKGQISNQVYILCARTNE